ncbi:hypothetical protein ACFY2V_03355 [Streptomyces eurythermus]|uniref:hypothetical protein n=1 Tax=Streptomyces eurythermus TaxID=42237 RepID=UPI0036A0F5A4
MILPYPWGPGRPVPSPERVPPGAAALLQEPIDRTQARIDCPARNRDRLAACPAAVGERTGRDPRVVHRGRVILP